MVFGTKGTESLRINKPQEGMIEFKIKIFIVYIRIFLSTHLAYKINRISIIQILITECVKSINLLFAKLTNSFLMIDFLLVPS